MTARPDSNIFRFENLLSENELCQSWMATNRRTGARCFVKMQADSDTIDPKYARQILLKSYSAQKKLHFGRVIRAKSKYTENKKLIIEYPFLDNSKWQILNEDRLQGAYPDNILQICLLVDYLHILNFVHNDLKLDNFHIATNGHAPKIVLTDMDFLQPAGTSPAGRVFGTPDHIAPEILENNIVTIKSDNYSLGISFKRLLNNMIAKIDSGDMEKLRNFIDRLTSRDLHHRPALLIAALYDSRVINKKEYSKCLKNLLVMQLLGSYASIRFELKNKTFDLKHFLVEKNSVFGLPDELIGDFESSFKINPRKAFHEFRLLLRDSKVNRYADFWQISVPDRTLLDIEKSICPEKFANVASAFGEPLSGEHQLNEIIKKIRFLKENKRNLLAYLYLRSFLDYSNPETFIDQQPSLVTAFNELGLLSRELGRFEQAVGYLERSLALAEDEKRIDLNILCNLVDIYFTLGQPQSAQNIVEKGISASRAQKNNKYENVLKRHQAWIYLCQSEFVQAKAILMSLKEDAKKSSNISELSKLNSIIGALHLKSGEQNQAVKYFKRSITLAEKSKDSINLLSPLSNLSILYYGLARYSKAIRLASQNIAILEKLSKPAQLSQSYIFLSNCCVRLGKFKKAEYWLARYLYSRSFQENVAFFRLYYFIKGFIDLHKGNIDTAINEFMSALELYSTDSHTYDIGKLYFNLAEAYMIKGLARECRRFLEKAKPIFIQLHDPATLAELELIDLQNKIYNEGQQGDKDLLNLFEQLLGYNCYYYAYLCLFHILVRPETKDKEAAINKIEPIMKSIDTSTVPLFKAVSRIIQFTNSVYKVKDYEFEHLNKAYKVLYSSGNLFFSTILCCYIADKYLEKKKEKLAVKFLLHSQRLAGILANKNLLALITNKLTAIDQKQPDKDSTSKIIQSISNILQDIKDYDNALENLLSFAVDQTGAERGVLLLKRKQSSDLKIKAYINCDDKGLGDIADFSNTIPQKVVESMEPLIIPDALSDDRTKKYKSIIAYNILSIICVPLKLKNDFSGVLYLDHHTIPALFDKDDVVFIKSIAVFISLLLSTIQDFKYLDTSKDQLTMDLKKLGVRQIPVTKNKIMLELLKDLPKMARTDASILIQGESGTGKEIISEMIHNMSLRSNGPLVKLNCAAISSTLIESELFGVGKNVATGVDARIGKFQAADGGTLFLDEIGDLPLNIQAKVLRVLEYQEFEKVGSNKKIYTDIRFIYATNKNLKEMIKKNKFREDLYFRISTIVIDIPPLRDRVDDIPLLIDEFMKPYISSANPPPIFLSEAKEAIVSYDWPGNVRELRNFVEHYCITHSGKAVEIRDLPKDIINSLSLSDKRSAASQLLEKEKIRRALIANKGNISKTAIELGIPYSTLRRKIKKYGP